VVNGPGFEAGIDIPSAAAKEEGGRIKDESDPLSDSSFILPPSSFTQGGSRLESSEAASTGVEPPLLAASVAAEGATPANGLAGGGGDSDTNQGDDDPGGQDWLDLFLMGVPHDLRRHRPEPAPAAEGADPMSAAERVFENWLAAVDGTAAGDPAAAIRGRLDQDPGDGRPCGSSVHPSTGDGTHGYVGLPDENPILDLAGPLAGGRDEQPAVAPGLPVRLPSADLVARDQLPAEVWPGILMATGLSGAMAGFPAARIPSSVPAETAAGRGPWRSRARRKYR
jgi:hypothetical protein